MSEAIVGPFRVKLGAQRIRFHGEGLGWQGWDFNEDSEEIFPGIKEGDYDAILNARLIPFSGNRALLAFFAIRLYANYPVDENIWNNQVGEWMCLVPYAVDANGALLQRTGPPQWINTPSLYNLWWGGGDGQDWFIPHNWTVNATALGDQCLLSVYVWNIHHLLINWPDGGTPTIVDHHLTHSSHATYQGDLGVVTREDGVDFFSNAWADNGNRFLSTRVTVAGNSISSTQTVYNPPPAAGLPSGSGFGPGGYSGGAAIHSNGRFLYVNSGNQQNAPFLFSMTTGVLGQVGLTYNNFDLSATPHIGIPAGHQVHMADIASNVVAYHEDGDDIVADVALMVVRPIGSSATPQPGLRRLRVRAGPGGNVVEDVQEVDMGIQGDFGPFDPANWTATRPNVTPPSPGPQLVLWGRLDQPGQMLGAAAATGGDWQATLIDTSLVPPPPAGRNWWARELQMTWDASGSYALGLLRFRGADQFDNTIDFSHLVVASPAGELLIGAATRRGQRAVFAAP